MTKFTSDNINSLGNKYTQRNCACHSTLEARHAWKKCERTSASKDAKKKKI